MPENFAFSISGAHHDTAGADTVRQLYVAMTISDHERARQVDAMFTGGPMQHAGGGLPAGAGVGRCVRAIIDAVEISSGVPQPNGHPVMDSVDERFRVVPASDTGLIGDDKDEKAALIQFADGSRGKWKHMKSRNVIQVADFFRNGAVAIEKNGGF